MKKWHELENTEFDITNAIYVGSTDTLSHQYGLKKNNNKKRVCIKRKRGCTTLAQ